MSAPSSTKDLPILASLDVLVLGWLATASQGEVFIDVPFVKQPKNLCGAATVSMVLRYWSRELELGDVPSLSEVAEAVSRNRNEGALGSDMRHYLESKGFRAFAFKGSRADLATHLARGRPLIVCLKRGSSSHYVVVAGHDFERGSVLVNDPDEKKLLELNLLSFEADWAAAEWWTLLAVPSPQEKKD